MRAGVPGIDADQGGRGIELKDSSDGLRQRIAQRRDGVRHRDFWGIAQILVM